MDAYQTLIDSYQMENVSDIVYAESFGFTSGYNAAQELIAKTSKKT